MVNFSFAALRACRKSGLSAVWRHLSQFAGRRPRQVQAGRAVKRLEPGDTCSHQVSGIGGLVFVIFSDE